VNSWGNVLKNAAAAGEPYIPYPVPNVFPTKNVSDPGKMINRFVTATSTQTEDDVPVEGLININTASWRVLAQLPLVMDATDGTNTRSTKNPNIYDGDFSPLSDSDATVLTGDRVRWDFKERLLMVTRIANLVTLKSDCYTAYIQVQGWRDSGTPQATLVSQKR